MGMITHNITGLEVYRRKMITYNITGKIEVYRRTTEMVPHLD